MRYFFIGKKKKMRQLMAVAMVLILATAMVAGCGKQHKKPAGNSGTPYPSTTNGISPEGPCVEHTDEDNNGLCDRCNVNVIVNIDIYAINDIHGRFSADDIQAGVDKMTTFFKLQELSDPGNVLISSGDSWQGTSESNNTKGALLTEWMQEVGFVSMTLGNHEFDWGQDRIKENDEKFDMPFLAINVYSKETGKPVDYCIPSVMVEREGVKIGIIGAIGDCYSSIQANFTQDICFKVGHELTVLVKAEVQKLKKEGADIIVYSIHDGYDRSMGSTPSVITDSNLSQYYDISLSNYVDVVFEAHTHREYVLKDSMGVYHIQAGGENSVGLSHADINYNTANKKKTVKAEIVNNKSFDTYAKDEIVENLLDKYSDQIGDVTTAVGYTDHTIDSDEISELVAMLYYKKGMELWGDKYDITLAGGFIKPRKPYAISRGEVAYADVQSVLPFDNVLCLCSVNGINLNNKFFENPQYYVYYEDYGEVIKGGIEPNGRYYIVVDSYTATYAPNNLTIVEELKEDIYARDLLIEYLKK